MRIRSNTGVKLTDTIDWALRDLMQRYNISRADARKLLAEAIVRNCVWDEIIDMCDWQLELKKED